MIKKTLWLMLFLSSVSLLTQTSPAKSAERELYVYNWSNYIDKNVIIDFEARYKAKVRYKTYDTISELRLLLEKLSYAPDVAKQQIDVIILPSFLLQGLIEQNLLAPIRKQALSNNKYIFTSLKKYISKAGQDIGRTDSYAQPYLWGTTALAYDARALSKRVRTFPRDSWELIFNPNIAAQFSDCGIVMTDRPRQIFQILRNYLGKDPHSAHKDDLLAVEIALRRLRPYVEVMSGFEASNAFAFGDACIVLGQSQELFLSQKDSKAATEDLRAQRGRLRKAPPQLVYKFPKQGSLLWMDVMVIPIQSTKRALGHKWINHVLNAENSKRIANITGFATPNRQTLRLLPKEIRTSKTLYPSLRNRKIFIDLDVLDANNLPSSHLREQEERAWERFLNLRK